MINVMDSISKSDWPVDRGLERKYFTLLNPYVNIHFEKIVADTYPGKGYDLIHPNIWFQQYVKGDFHSWHNHGSSWSTVYFVELPDPSFSTMFYLPFNKEEIQIDVKEGDFITFPGFIFHKSPVNTSDKRKTIIAFNTIIYNHNEN